MTKPTATAQHLALLEAKFAEQAFQANKETTTHEQR
jgi:hypothetical protein